MQNQTHFNGGGWTIKPTIHIIMDPMIQHMNAKTKKPATMVRKGGPWAASALLVSFDPSEALVFEANTVCSLGFTCSLYSFLNLNGRNDKVVCLAKTLTTGRTMLWFSLCLCRRFLQLQTWTEVQNNFELYAMHIFCCLPQNHRPWGVSYIFDSPWWSLCSVNTYTLNASLVLWCGQWT